MHDEPEVQVRQQKQHARRVNTREVTFTCTVCEQTVTQHRFPGPVPLYCSNECKQTARREQMRELMRARRKAGLSKKRGRPRKTNL
ncbi:MAG: hypothetical protein CLLPBCKN_007104 [Chroococcidiopsis cubana SAG 39.79]|uniref:Uncharacterized protein n=1 Tax=Chroococcidiopsis cubana SAG 39.79 TaxID=388085 RepID=A0AB37U9A9_9CYAN|nr:hypothetical protein [Chroococcidiopsis cubana]MDZ4877669.1 hypothetical protein [Chroococcidiopsis cubana SAG 39.79]RUT00459.1 hypothetical protein DSM107010_67960 [Chroococcidiopsis cubana SAG 39.79]